MPVPNTREDLRLHLKRRAYHTGVNIVLASGRRSDWYVDCRQVTMDPTGYRLTARALAMELEVMRPDHWHLCIAGVLDGGAPLVMGVAMIDLMTQPILVRKEAKAHGKGGRLVCTDDLLDDAVAREVILLEDVVTTGGSVVRAKEALFCAGFVVHDVLALVDREEGGRELLREHGMGLHALFRRSDFSDCSLP
jgi:orotate phosphoribosyltransferase